MADPQMIVLKDGVFRLVKAIDYEQVRSKGIDDSLVLDDQVIVIGDQLRQVSSFYLGEINYRDLQHKINQIEQRAKLRGADYYALEEVIALSHQTLRLTANLYKKDNQSYTEKELAHVA